MFEQMKGLTPKKKIEYYWEYYGKITLVVVAIAIAVISFIVQQVTAKEEAGGVVVINALVFGNEETKQEEYFNDLLRSLDMNPGEYEIAVNTGIRAGSDVGAQMQMTSIQLLQALIASRSVDIVFSDEAYFSQFVKNDCLADLRDYLDEDVLERNREKLIYHTEEESGREIVAGIRVSNDSKWMQGMNWYMSDSCVGIIVNPAHEEVAVHMLLRAIEEEEF